MKVIASDFDNTLYVKDESILQKNIKSVKDFINRGNTFIIITGRSYTNIKKLLTEYEIPYKYLVCQDGANIFDENDKCLKSNLLNKEVALNIEKYLKENNIEYSFESAFNDYDTIDKAVKITVTIDENTNPKEILEEIKQIDSVYAYVSSRHVNVINYDVNKSSALKYLEENNYINNDITVMGDDINDYEMMSKYHGVIMKNHDEILDELNKKEIDSVNEYLDSLI